MTGGAVQASHSPPLFTYNLPLPFHSLLCCMHGLINTGLYCRRKKMVLLELHSCSIIIQLAESAWNQIVFAPCSGNQFGLSCRPVGSSRCSRDGGGSNQPGVACCRLLQLRHRGPDGHLYGLPPRRQHGRPPPPVLPRPAASCTH